MASGRVTRDWTEPIQKVRAEGRCRACPERADDPAHLWPRSLGGSNDPANTCPLCRGCHTDFDAGRFDLGPVLTVDEKVQVVREAEAHGREGLAAAHRRLYPSLNP